MFNSLGRWLGSRSPQRRRNGARAEWNPARPQVELLEDRLAPAVYNVISTADGPATAALTMTAPGVFNAPSLRAAIQAANANAGGNTINLTIAGTYKITIPGAREDNNATGDFDILPTGGNLTIQNTSGGTALVDGNGLDRVFDINPGNTSVLTNQVLVTMQGFTIQNGRASPGDMAAGSGGGIRDQGNVNLTLTNMVVTNNSATADGGGVVMLNSANNSWTLTINNSTISDNHAGDAGGGIDTDGTGKVFINAGTVVSGNTDLNQGAGIYIDTVAVGMTFPGASMTMTGTVVSNNTALAAGVTASGGGISNAGNGTMTIVNSTVASNFSGGNGGGFSDENNVGSLVVSNSLFADNSAIGDGGGIQEGGPSTTITNTSLRGNSSGGSGGGLFANGPTLTVTGSNFVNNTATVGGGIEVRTTGTGANSSSITNSTLTGNSALNNAGANGGGIDAPTAFTGTLTLLNDTINGNFADNGGGILWAGAGSAFNVQNTILAKNTASTSGPDALTPGTFTDNGGNLVGIAGAGSGNAGFTAATTQTGTTANPLDPLLGPLQNNGGPTVGAAGTAVLETESLLSGSKALDKGVASGAPAVDERGLSRPDAGTGELPDVGAFEFQDVTLMISITPAAPTVFVGGTDTFTVTVTNTSGNALPADNSTLSVTLSAGLTATGPVTFKLGALGAGQRTSFSITATATAAGSQTATATVTGVDINPNFISSSTTITVRPTPPPPSVSVAFGPVGEVLEVVDANGMLTQFDSTGAHVLGGGIRSASVAFGPLGEVLVVVTFGGTLTQFDAAGAHTLTSGVQSASVAFGPFGEMLVVVGVDSGTLTQFDATGAHVLGSGIRSASVAFGPFGEVLALVGQDGTLTQFDAAGAHTLASGILSASVAFTTGPGATEVLDVIFANGLLEQFSSSGMVVLGKLF